MTCARGSSGNAFGPLRVTEFHDELCDPAPLIGRHADRHAFQSQRLDDLSFDGFVHAGSGDAPDHLAHEESVRDAVVTVARPRRVPRRFGRESGAHEVPIEHLVGVTDHVAQLMEAGGVIEELAHRDAFLARGRELGPVVGDGRVVIDQSPVDEAVHRGGDDPLGGREAHGHRVGFPRSARGVAGPGPGIYDQFAPVVHRHRGSAATLVGGHMPERLCHTAEFGMYET